ncbi:Max dimerization protein [Apis cerana cerana]|uniref:Max dimerization protein n=1 Tax=Apis cerana cerana TaxID=94128 RepID=A0A2A3EEZ3_APICC|nr:Max dimerization protein [Apis cerana cerana]
MVDVMSEMERNKGIELEAEHGYASTMPMPDDMRTVTKRPKTKKSQGSRTTHNELEKNSSTTLVFNPKPRHCSVTFLELEVQTTKHGS